MATQASIITQDDIFYNVNLFNDPAYSNLSGYLRDDYLTVTLKAYYLNALDAQGENRIDFESDYWNLRPFLKKGEKAPSTGFHFEDLPNDAKQYLKFFLNYFRKKENVKVSTLFIRYANIKNLLVDILSKNKRIDFDGITTQMIQETIDSRGLAPESNRSYYTSITKFYDYLIRVCNLALLVDIDELIELMNKAVKTAKRDDTRLPNIPEQVAQEIRTTALKVMRDENVEYRFRLVACAIIMLFRLGVRIDDLMDFRTDDLKKDATEVKGYKISYITYFIHKLTRHNGEAFNHTIFATSDCVEAFETLLDIRQTQPASNTDFLFVYKDKPVTKQKISEGFYPLYMYMYHPDICKTDKYKDAFTPNSSCHYAPARGKTLYFPETRQYRVYLCTELYAKGVSRNFVEEHLKHLSVSMANYYNRPEDKLPEYIAYAENVLETMIVEKVNPIGLAGPQIRQNIEQFLQKNEFNVKKDFGTIMDVLGDKVSIRAKTGGFCFKTSLVPCAQEAGTNKMLCAYNLCPNVYSFYYMVDYSYSEFKGHIEAYEQNFFKGLKNSAQKELYEIQSLILRALEPQIRQLEEEIQKSGFKAIAEKHPNIIDIAKDLETIKKEIREWKAKTEK